jgi:hypothetical protein
MNLKCRQVNEQHFAVNIQRWLREVLREFEINDSQVLSFTIDSERSLTKAVDDLIDDLDDEDRDENSFAETYDDAEADRSLLQPIDEETEEIPVESDACDDDALEDITLGLGATRIHCAVHRLQLGIKDFLKLESNQRLVVIGQKLSGKLRAPKMRIQLSNAKLKVPKMYQETRWSSTFDMFERLLELEDFIKTQQRLWDGEHPIFMSYKRLQSIKICSKAGKVVNFLPKLQHVQRKFFSNRFDPL